MKMKELEARTGIGREAIRFYIREGLLPQPEKPKRNVAIYNETHVDRIRLIKKLQDERFLPLSEIRSLIDSFEDEEALSDNFRGLEFQLAARLGANSLAPKSVDRLVQETELEIQDLRELESAGLIHIDTIKGSQTLSGQDARIAILWSELVAAGFTREYGFEPANLERYLRAAEEIADDEVEGFFELLPGSRSTRDAAALAETGLAIVEQVFSILHTKAVLAAVARRTAEETMKD